MITKRIEWIDISKGIGAILVIIGHCVYIGGYVHNWIFSFHMQLFFIISGLFFTQSPFLSCVKKKYKQLIVPYMVFCLIGFALSILIPQWRGFSYKDILRDIYFGYPNTVNVSSVWFLICLFFTFLMFDLVLMVQEKTKIFGWLLFIGIIVFGFSLGRFSDLIDLFPASRMPFDIDSACVAILFLGIGYYSKKDVLKIADIVTRNRLILILATITSFFVTVLVTQLNGTVNLHGIVYHNEILYIIGGTFGFLMVMFTSVGIQQCIWIKKCFVWLGLNSLKLMGTQAIILRIYLLVLNHYGNDEFVIYCLPPLYAMIGCFAITSISVICVGVYNACYRRFMEKACISK